ncbi:MAG: carnitinyl-CoA dehydratase [Rhodospirillaceae bacterium]|nr:carnitinyl-CoA dehydratase [Rhodospirillaceae bacterium]
MSDIVRTCHRGRVLEITFDRPPVNAINGVASRALYAAFRELRDDPALSVGLLTGTGERVFSAGWDLKEAARAKGVEKTGPESGHSPGGFAGNTEFWDLNKPLIAAVNGAAVGGGFELALACDIIVAADHAWFELPEMQRGILADAGALQRLPRRIPYNVAVELLLTGRRLEVEEAVRWGLVHKAVPVDRLMAEARALAQRVAEGAPLALQAAKDLLTTTESMPLSEAMAIAHPGKSGLESYERMANSEDAREGPRAFVEKRKPVWKGR